MLRQPSPARYRVLAVVFIATAACAVSPIPWAGTALHGIDLYQRNLSGRLPGIHCRHEESCSNYCKRCIEQHGLLYGSYLGLRRIACCW
jgi:putative component of membrane protein insertase Oxa1/YidC/SpoIIIJ protein YidD